MAGKFIRGDNVMLTIDGFDVASGTVQKIDPRDSVQNILLGENRIGVLIEKVLERTTKLPFRMPRAESLFDAIDSCVIWDLSCTYLSGTKNSQKRSSIGSCSNQPVRDSNLEKTPLEEEDSSTTLRPGDTVEMFMFGCCVALGVVFKTNPMDRCHNVLLGESRISVGITDVIQGSRVLPYRQGGAETIEDAKDSWVLWDVANVQKKVLNRDVDGSRKSCSKKDEGEKTGVEQSFVAEEPSAQNLKPNCDYLQRSSWMSELVELYIGSD